MTAHAAAVESYAPYRFTVDEVARMVEAGILSPDARVELIGGRLLNMAPENPPHVRAKIALTRWLVQRLGDERAVAPDATLRLSAHDAPEPDLYVYPAEVAPDALTGAAVDLVIEIADTSLDYDRDLKAPLYARHGVRECWILDVNTDVLLVHRDPSPAGYGQVAPFGPEDPVRPLAFPELEFTLAGLPPVR